MDQLSMESKLSLRQAYLVMFDYLEGFYERNEKPDEIGILLGQLSLWDSAEGKVPIDGAVFPDWLISAKQVFDAEASDGYNKINIQISKE